MVLAMLVIVSLMSCNKKEIPLSKEEQVITYLTGVGNRYWKIRELYINTIPQSLTAAQLGYWKVYTLSISTQDAKGGSFTDESGYRGTWTLDKTADKIDERVDNLPSGPVSYLLKILKLGPNDMDVEYTANGSTVRTVYYAY
jgi:uncharacterized protein (DUF779 family)